MATNPVGEGTKTIGVNMPIEEAAIIEGIASGRRISAAQFVRELYFEEFRRRYKAQALEISAVHVKRAAELREKKRLALGRGLSSGKATAVKGRAVPRNPGEPPRHQ